MKKITFLFVFYSSFLVAQTITVDSNTYTATDLANLLVTNACITPTNISYSSGQSVAYFNQNSSSFPMAEGIIIRNGVAQFTEGLYTNTNLSSQINSNGDANLQAISNSSGQNATITDVAFLQFDFVPISSNFNFEFLFASNEYGQYQCGFSDVFAFLLTDLTTNTTTNLAVIPGTSTPVSVKDIRNNLYNTACSSVNPTLFDVYNVNNPVASTLNMRGHTVVLNASATITPNNPYRIRLVIGDYSDATFDSAVFIGAGSFTNSIDLGPNTSLCSGDTLTLTTGLDNALYTHSWTLDGNPLAGEVTNTLTVTQPGVYSVTAIRNGTTCEITDTITINNLQVNTPNDLFVCDDGSGAYNFNLTLNNEASLGINNATYDVFYYATQADIIANNPIPNPANYSSAGNETVFIKIFNTLTSNFCDAEWTFDLLLTTTVTATAPNDIELCNTANIQVVSLSNLNPEVLNGQNPANFVISYHNSQADALADTGALGSSVSVTLASSPQTIWVRMETATNSSCFDVISFTITVHPLPLVDEINDVLECSSYLLPPITNGNYFTGSDGTGTPLFAGDTIDLTGTYYIFIGPDANGCTNQSSFFAEFIDEYTIPLEHCGQYNVPVPPVGDFYTATGGPNGTGSIIPPGTTITSSQTIYYYAEIEGVFCRDEAFPLVIHPLPIVDILSPVITCDSYILQPLTNGNYFTGSGGTGTALFAGDTISTTSTIYVYANDGICPNQEPFEITILSPPQNVVGCATYTLPNPSIGNYYSQAGGQGQLLSGTTLTNSQTVFYYANTTTSPNCTDNYSFTVTITPSPPVDTLNNVNTCINDPYVLPTITNGNYFTGTGGTGTGGTGTALFAGDTISSSQTIYIYNIQNGCPNQSFFNVIVEPFPQVTNLTDVFECDPYTLPNIANGSFYTAPGGQGTMLPPGTLIDTTQTIYIYNASATAQGCASENVFVVNILGVDVGTFTDVQECDSYTLPPLSVGNYFYQPNGIDPIPLAEQTITTVGTTTIYVYAKNGVRPFCDDEDVFNVTISETPTLPLLSSVQGCAPYTLPVLDNTNYNIGYYWEPNGVNPIIATQQTFDVPGVYTVYVYASAFNNSNCKSEGSFQVTVYPLLDLPLDDVLICIDPITNETIEPALVNTYLSPSLFTVNWFLNGVLVHTGPFYYVQQVGTYTVEIIKLTPEIGSYCNYNPSTFTVSQSSPAVAEIITSEDFEDVATITVNVTNGSGNYEFQLDNGPFQTSTVFYNVANGEHTITIRDTLGCETLILNALILKYPRFFSPNGDGINDTWNIWDLQNRPNSFISIFDRYGKFIKQFSTQSNGWDGAYNNQNNFANDYWFVVKYTNLNNEQKEYRGHFSLIR